MNDNEGDELVASKLNEIRFKFRWMINEYKVMNDNSLSRWYDN